jgi:hypothetical protein
VDDFYIRIVNNDGFDEDGFAIYDDHDSTIYTSATDGMFMHLAWSPQSFRKPRVHRTNYTRYNEAVDMYTPVFEAGGIGDGKGIQMLWADDWEDYGFMSYEDFDALDDEIKDMVRANEKAAQEQAEAEAILEWIQEHDCEHCEDTAMHIVKGNVSGAFVCGDCKELLYG